LSTFIASLLLMALPVHFLTLGTWVFGGTYR
jgi:hypothetical protein